MAVITDNFTLPDFSGDAGAGGTHGLVPAPAAGDGTDKYLKADGTWSSTPEIQEDPGAGVGLIEANPPGGPTVLKNVRDGQGTRVIANTGSFQTDVHFSAPDVAFVSDALGDPTEVPVAETSGSEVIVRALPTGKIDLSFIPDSILGQVEYQGVWNASTNTPTLANPPASTTKGDFYIANVAGTQFGISFGVGDWIISDGTAWSKVDNTDAISSVFGRIGAVLATLGDYAASLITNDSVQSGATVKSVLDALTALAFVTPGTGVAAALAQAINTASGFITQTGGDARYIRTTYSNIQPLPVQYQALEYQWLNMPAALTFFNGATRYMVPCDLTGASQINLKVFMSAVPGFAGSKIVLRYRTFAAGFDATPANWNILGDASTEVQCACDSGLAVLESGYIDIVAAAKGSILLGVFGVGGDTATDPIFLGVAADIKSTL